MAEENKKKVEEAMRAAQARPAQPPQGASLVERVNKAGCLMGFNQKDITTYLSGMRDRIAAVLPKHITPERIISMAATTIAKNPQIAKCSPGSLLGALMQTSILGFPPVDALGYCYFVPFNNRKVVNGVETKVPEVQFQIGYKGLIELARRSGKIKTVYAEVVREGDEFEVEFGLNPNLRHVPMLDAGKPMKYVYAVCHFTDGGYNFVVLSKSDVERLRLRSPMQKGAPSGAWLTDYDSMAKAKALKQLAKYMPLNIDQQEAIATDEAVLTPDNFQAGRAKIEDVEYANEVEAVEAAAEDTDEQDRQ